MRRFPTCGAFPVAGCTTLNLNMSNIRGVPAERQTRLRAKAHASISEAEG